MKLSLSSCFTFHLQMMPLWPLRCIIWNLTHVAFLFKVGYSSVIRMKVPSGKKQEVRYLQIHWTFLRRGYGCSETGWLHGQTGLGGTLRSWQPHWDRWAGSPRSCTGAGWTAAAAGAGMTLLKQKQELFSAGLFRGGYRKPSCGGQPYLSTWPSAGFGTIIAGVGKNQHFALGKFRYVIIFAQIYSWRSRLLLAFLYFSQKCFYTLQTFGA